MNRGKVLLIIPAYNEALSISSVIDEAHLRHPDHDILVINDGSLDSTSEEARQAGAMVLDLCYNLGIGGAVRAGYKFGRENSYQIVARIDADGQHDPASLDNMIDVIRRKQADIVIGTRYLNQRRRVSSAIRLMGIRFFATLVSLVTGQRFTDTTSGFLVVNQDCCAFLAQNLPTDYPEIEGLVKACRAGYTVEEIPVAMRARMNGSSSIGSLDALYYVFKVTLGILISASRRKEGR